jgi:hypothetical protein
MSNATASDMRQLGYDSAGSRFVLGAREFHERDSTRRFFICRDGTKAASPSRLAGGTLPPHSKGHKPEWLNAEILLSGSGQALDFDRDDGCLILKREIQPQRTQRGKPR